MRRLRRGLGFFEDFWRSAIYMSPAAFSVIISVSLAGCVASKQPSTREIMNSWMGNHISQVIRSWGAYDQVVSDGAGGKIYIWITYRDDSILDILPPPRGNSISAAIARVQRAEIRRRAATPLKREMYVGPNGGVYSWRVSGE